MPTFCKKKAIMRKASFDVNRSDFLSAIIAYCMEYKKEIPSVLNIDAPYCLMYFTYLCLSDFFVLGILIFLINSFIYYPKYVKYAFYTVKYQNMLKYAFM